MKHDAAVHVPIINVISKQYSVFNHEGMDSFDGCSFTSAKIICEFKSFKQVHSLVLSYKINVKMSSPRMDLEKE